MQCLLVELLGLRTTGPQPFHFTGALYTVGLTQSLSDLAIDGERLTIELRGLHEAGLLGRHFAHALRAVSLS
jgi:hypothetical protein